MAMCYWVRIGGRRMHWDGYAEEAASHAAALQNYLMDIVAGLGED
jgi:hypothetical protein